MEGWVVGPVVDRGRGMISLGMVDSVVNGMVGSWATNGKRDFHVGNKYKFFLTSVVPQPGCQYFLLLF